MGEEEEIGGTESNVSEFADMGSAHDDDKEPVEDQEPELEEHDEQYGGQEYQDGDDEPMGHTDIDEGDSQDTEEWAGSDELGGDEGYDEYLDTNSDPDATFESQSGEPDLDLQ